MARNKHRNNGKMITPMGQWQTGESKVKRPLWVLVEGNVSKERIAEILRITNEQALDLIQRAMLNRANASRQGSARYGDFKLVYRFEFDLYRKV
jgi:hypothetical protein